MLQSSAAILKAITDARAVKRLPELTQLQRQRLQRKIEKRIAAKQVLSPCLFASYSLLQTSLSAQLTLLPSAPSFVLQSSAQILNAIRDARAEHKLPELTQPQNELLLSRVAKRVCQAQVM